MSMRRICAAEPDNVFMNAKCHLDCCCDESMLAERMIGHDIEHTVYCGALAFDSAPAGTWHPVCIRSVKATGIRTICHARGQRILELTLSCQAEDSCGRRRTMTTVIRLDAVRLPCIVPGQAVRIGAVIDVRSASFHQLCMAMATLDICLHIVITDAATCRMIPCKREPRCSLPLYPPPGNPNNWGKIHKTLDSRPRLE